MRNIAFNEEIQNFVKIYVYKDFLSNDLMPLSSQK